MKHKELASKKDIENLRNSLLNWGKKNCRKYPWRDTSNTFHFLIAEMLLQRTNADQVLPVYTRFVEKYSTPEDIANARLEVLEKELFSLGLKYRSTYLKKLSQYILDNFDGITPETRDALKELPGVSEYKAGAILAIVFNQPEWFVDTNVVRIFKMYFGYQISKEGRRDKIIVETSKIFMNTADAKLAALAILDYPALICKPKPLCGDCIVSVNCAYNNTNYQLLPK